MGKFIPDSDEFYHDSVAMNELLEASSIRSYRNNITRIVKDTDAKTIHALLIDPAKYAPKFDTLFTYSNTRFSYFITVLVYLNNSGLKGKDRSIFLKWYKPYYALRKIVNDQVNNHVPSKKQLKAMVAWAHVLKTRDSLKIGSMAHLVLSIYSYVPPRRQLDYFQLRIYNDPKLNVPLTHNFFHTCHPKHGPLMYINKFKTVKHLHPFYNKEIPKELVDIFKQSYVANPREFAFVDNNNEPFKLVNTFTQFTNNIFKKAFNNKYVTLNSIRHAFSTYSNNIPGITLHQRSRNAIQMGHTLKKDMAYELRRPDLP
jgi:hypothetical protein